MGCSVARSSVDGWCVVQPIGVASSSFALVECADAIYVVKDTTLSTCWPNVTITAAAAAVAAVAVAVVALPFSCSSPQTLGEFTVCC